MPDNPVLQIVLQRAEGDCGIAVLAMYLGRSYEDVLVAAAKLDKKVHHKGMWVNQIERTAKSLGVKLRRRHSWDMDTASGILSLDAKYSQKAHVVVLKAGLIFDTNGTVWEPDIYFIDQQYKPTILLERKD